MSRREDENQSSEQGEEYMEGSDAAKIASTIGTRTFFLEEQARNLDEWADTANQIFLQTGEVFVSQYEQKAAQILENYSGNHDDSYARCRKQFDAFCILNRKVEKKNSEIENLAAHLNHKNTKKSFFLGWKNYADHKKYLRKMEDQAVKYQQKRCMKMVLKSWLHITMENTKTKIKNDVLQKTQMEVSRIQTEYERLIKNLEEALQKKLSELRKEEEEHKQLHDKYENMYARAKVEPSSGRN